MAVLRAVQLRAEARFKPLGIDETRPELSWHVVSSEPYVRHQKQTAYHILVYTESGASSGDLWDSGQVLSTETTVAYDGSDLAVLSGQHCFWKVKLWNETGTDCGWSDEEHWSMGLISSTEWKGLWIGSPPTVPVQSEEQQPSTVSNVPGQTTTLILPPALYLRHNFQLPDTAVRALLYATAKGLYQVSINGQQVADDYFTPGWTDYDKRIHYQTYDVTDLLAPGPNTIGATLADGWYAGYIGWQLQRHHYGERKQLLLHMEVTCRDGTTLVVASDGTWKCSEGPIRETDFLMGETYDARMEMPGWSAPGFDASSWNEVVEEPIDHEGALLQAYPCEPVRAFAEVAAREVTEPRPGTFVFNLGQNFAGIVRLKVAGAVPGTRVVLRYAERLYTDGSLYTENLRTARATDTYVCSGSGSGVEHWHPRFTFHGFQYVEVTGYPGTPPLDAVVGIALSSNAHPGPGYLETSDPMVNQLLSNITWTQRANFIELPTDCPQRDERLGWTGDAQIYIRTASFLADVQPFFRKWLQDLQDAQAESGQFPMFAPLAKLMRILDHKYAPSQDGGPAWADAGVICPWALYQVYGDRRTLQRAYPSMKRFVDFYFARCGDGLLPPEAFHCFGDWLNIDDDTPKDLIFSAYMAHSTHLTAQAAAALQNDQDAGHYMSLFQTLRGVFQSTYLEAATQRLKGDSQSAYVLAIAFELLDAGAKAAAAARLRGLIEGRGGCLSTGFVGTKELMGVLSSVGHHQVACSLLQSRKFPSWGFSIHNGATSIWERWNGWTPEKGFNDPGMNSFAHYAFGAVGQWLFEHVAGIQAAEPGFTRIRLCPRPGGSLSSVKSHFDSPVGRIKVEWQLEGVSMVLHVVLPCSSVAELHLLCGEPAEITESGTALPECADISVLRVADGQTVVLLGSGTYKFVVPYSLANQ